VSLSDAKLRAARARIASARVLASQPVELGEIRLRSDQLHTLARVRGQLRTHGGCLLAEEVGSGKTYVALALAREFLSPLVVVPAALRETWREAMQRAGVVCDLATHEALSRGRIPTDGADLVIVDESHHYRSLATRRHHTLAALVAKVPLLLMSATPLQNRPRDLAAQLALFLGECAFRLTHAELAHHVVRGPEGQSESLPVVATPEWIAVDADDAAVLRALLSLPSPPRAADAGDGGVLRTLGLTRAWASSRAALVAMLRGRERAGIAIEQALESGRLPTRQELRAWQYVGGDVQLGFAPLLVEQESEVDVVATLRATVAVECEALDRIGTLIRSTPDPDLSRVDALRRLRADHPGTRILVFSELARTVRAYYDRLSSEPGVGMLTAREARIASGRIPRRELLSRFAPAAQGARAPHRREEVTLLLATDLLSEGVNLQDASVVVHLDLPWNPARLAQRVGRVRRPGGAAVVRTYLIAPPAQATELLAVEARLRQKLSQAEQTIGRTFDVVPRLGPDGPDSRDGIRPLGEAEAEGALERLLAGWRCSAPRRWCRERPIVAGVRARRCGWLSVLSDGRVVAAENGSVPDASTTVRALAPLADGSPRPLRDVEVRETLVAIARWLRNEHIARECGLDEVQTPTRRDVERTVARLLHGAPRHERGRAIALASELRARLHSPLPLGTERQLRTLIGHVPDSCEGDALAWLPSVLQATRRSPAPTNTASTPVWPMAVILFGGGCAEN
jgi:superfamily II DNA or RNA helicase